MNRDMATYDAQLETCLQSLEKGDFKQCLELTTELQKKYPESAEAFHVEAMAHQFQFNWNESIKALDRAIENAPYDASLYNLRAFAKMNLDELSDAENDLTEAIELEDLEVAHRNRVLLYILREKYDDAAQYLYNRLVTNPDDVENWLMMGDLLKRAGFDEKAATYFDEARRRAPDHPAFA